MTIFLNIALLLISATATLAAFGGKTWRDGTEPVIERITARGWISLFCLSVALAVGITKEIWTQKESALKDAVAALQLSQTKSDLAEANANLQLLNQKATLTQYRLNDANTSLSDVRTTLNSARIDLDQQSAASMVTALASARANVSDMYFVVPPTSLANTEASVRGQLLPELLDRKCDSATQLDATFSLGNDNTETITYRPSDLGINHLYSEGGVPKIDGVGTLIMPGESHFIAQLQELLKQKTTNQMFYYVDIRTHEHNVSIAQLYDTLSRPGSEIFRLVASSPDNHHYPLQCSNQIRDYFQKAFEKAALMLISDDPHGELFIFKLNAQVERTEEGQWAVKFVSFTQPIVMAADPSITDVMAQSWKAASQPDPRKIRSLDAIDSFHAWLPDVNIPPGSPDTWPRLNALIQSKHAQSDILASTNSVTKKDAELARTLTVSASIAFRGCSARLTTTTTNVDKNHKLLAFGQESIEYLPLSQINIGTIHFVDIDPGTMYVDLISPVIKTESGDRQRTSHYHTRMLTIPTSSDPAQSVTIAQEWYAAAVNCGTPPLPTVWNDETSALMWARKDNDNDINWNDAGQYCHSLKLDEFGDWRLPTIDELHSMFFDKNTFNRKARMFTLGYDFWSSTSGNSKDQAQAFDIMGGGGAEVSKHSDTKGHRALCVRDTR